MPATEDAPSGDKVVCGRAAKKEEEQGVINLHKKDFLTET